MKKYLIFLLVTSCLLSCKKSKTEETVACGVKNPIQNLVWLNKKYKQFTGGPELNSIVLYEYKGNQVIEIQQSVSSKFFDLYNCEGTMLMIDDANGLNDYLANRKKIYVLYGTWQVELYK